jgi:hypothetical protein
VARQQDIDRVNLILIRAIVARIDSDPERRGIDIARQNCARWLARRPHPAVLEWAALLNRPWSEVRQIMLDESDEGQRLRSSSPFTGILTPQERWQIMRECHASG